MDHGASVLIGSRRLSAADVAGWEQLAECDRLRGRLAGPGRRAVRSRGVLERFCRAGPCAVSVSWGKDSVVLAHILALLISQGRVDPAAAPLVHVRPDRMDSPETALVRDAFLARFPQVRYEETVFSWRVPLKGEPGWLPGQPGQDALAECLGSRHGGRRVTGVRKAESPSREAAMAAYGDATARTCRPIGWWTTDDVFAWLAAADLPVHPAYAMSMGGAYQRGKLRVHWLGTDVAHLGWEMRYYADVYARESRAAPAVLAALAAAEA